MSGDAAAYGKPFLDAILAGAEELNNAGGILGKPIKVLFYDDRGVPDLALQAVKKLVLDDKVHALHPGSTSGCIFTSMPVGKDNKMPMWSYGLAKQIATKGEGMIYRSTPPDQVTIPALARFAHKKGWRRVGIIHVDHYYGEFVRDIFEKSFEAEGSGAKIVAKVSQSEGARDVSSQLLTIARANPDCVYMGTNGSAFAPTLRQIRQFLPKNMPVLTDTEMSYPNFRDELKSLADGAYYYNSRMSETNPDPLNQKWIGILKKKLGTYQEIMGRGPVGLVVLKEALERAKTIEGIAVMREVHRLKDFPTMAGPFTYDPRDGECIKSGVIVEVTPGGDPTKDKVVETYQTTDAVYDERVDYTRFFGAGYREELYKFHDVS
jgi:branched-chain amino acid transport system substrate-binding protein